MTIDDAQLRDLLDQAADLPPDRREHFLATACANSPHLRTRVQSLLDELDQATDFLVDPAIDAATLPPLSLQHSALSIPSSPSTIDRYQLLEPLGEGGMGSVFRALQLSPVRREVALKLIKPGTDTRQVIARFEAERQTLALMDHPSIAKVLDAGATETGRPFFVMELVHGTPLTDYCDQHNLPLQDRLELFTQVCNAVQHAHQKGIIHRDLKPSNVLVTRHDDKPVPKIIDFGIAKAITPQPATSHSTGLTQLAHPPGTPMYMSPEQFDHNCPNTDTRSDIYSLGVLLYHLLTGLPPFDPAVLDSAPPRELHRIVTTESPPRPSTRIHDLTPTAAAPIAAHRATDPKSLIAALRDDLDWIVMRCLEKDRDRRYESASSLARDIDRHLHDQPVEAGPPSNLYLAKKFVHRHRNAIAAASVAIILLAVATAAGVTSLWQSARASRAEAERLTQKQRADAESQLRQAEMLRADHFAQVLKQIIRTAQPTNGSTGQDLHVTDLLKNASLAATTYLRTIPDTEIEVRLQLAAAFASADAPDDAKENLLRAYHLACATPDSESSKCAVHVAAELAYYLDDIPFSRLTYTEAQRLFGPTDPITQRAAHSLAQALTQPSPDGTIPADHIREAETISRALVNEVTSLAPAQARPEHYQYMNQLAALLIANQKSPEAADVVHRALDTGTRTGQLRDSTRAALNLTLIQSLRAQNRLPEALDQARKSLDFARATIGSSNPTTTQTQQAYTDLLATPPR